MIIVGYNNLRGKPADRCADYNSAIIKKVKIITNYNTNYLDNNNNNNNNTIISTRVIVDHAHIGLHSSM